MRVAYVCADPEVQVFGRRGASVRMQEMIRTLVRYGAHVALFAARLEGKRPSDWCNVALHQLPAIPKGELIAQEHAVVAMNEALRHALEREGPFDFVYERYTPWSYAGMVYARERGIPGLLEVSALPFEERTQRRDLTRRAEERLSHRAFGAATALLATSGAVAAHLVRHPAARGRVHEVPNGVDPRRFHPGLVPALSGGPGRFTIGFVGALEPWCGLEVLADAFAMVHRNVPKARLLIVGDGPQREDLVARLAAHGVLDAVHFAGMVDPQDVPAWVASMDVGVAPSPRRKGGDSPPLKVLEYMAAGVPVVASRVTELTRLIESGVNGILVPPGNAVALASALERLYVDPDLRAHLGPAGRRTVLRHHTWDAVVRRVLDLVQVGVSPVMAFAGAAL